MLQQNSNKNNQDKDLSKSTSSFFEKFQIRGGRFEKRLFLLLIILVIVLVPLSIWQFNKNLTDPFSKDNVAVSNSNTNSSFVQNNSSSTIPLLENLREIDTDQDGISDYDELYRYKTSPYLQDSDSDGIVDNIEIEQGTDPNCPEGNTCSRVAIEDDTGGITDTNNGGVTVAEDLSIDQLRQIMIDAGAPEEEVYKIPEEDLLSTYQLILEEEGLANNSTEDDILGINVNTTTSGTIYDDLTIEKLQNLTPEEIRELLVEGGVPANEIAAIDDDTLQQIYLESLYQNFNELNQQ